MKVNITDYKGGLNAIGEGMKFYSSNVKDAFVGSKFSIYNADNNCLLSCYSKGWLKTKIDISAINQELLPYASLRVKPGFYSYSLIAGEVELVMVKVNPLLPLIFGYVKIYVEQVEVGELKKKLSFKHNYNLELSSDLDDAIKRVILIFILVLETSFMRSEPEAH